VSAESEVARVFGKNLRRLRRERAGISQEELSRLSSLHRTEVSQLERGLRVARVDTLVKLAAGLDVTPNDLLESITWQPAKIEAGRFE
jgi:transcriptional regulator with XRE-family HTH domain